MFKKFKGHYSKRKTHKTDRDVMSYEDMPLDDYEQEKTEMSPQAVKKIVLGACIAIAAGLIVFAFANRDKLTWRTSQTGGLMMYSEMQVTAIPLTLSVPRFHRATLQCHRDMPCMRRIPRS